MKESRVEIPAGSGNFYRYGYADGKTHYLGPMGSSPALSEEEFQRNISIVKGPLVQEGKPTMVEEDLLLWLIEKEHLEPTSATLFNRLGIPSSDHDRIRKRIRIRQKLAGNVIEVKGEKQYHWKIIDPQSRVFASGESASWNGALQQMKVMRERHEMPEKNIDVDRVIREYDPQQNLLPGGEGDNMNPAVFDRLQVEWGIMVELEHTDDPNISLEITMDHLAEDHEYYTKLETIDPHLTGEHH
jgi:hypothetical protein